MCWVLLADMWFPGLGKSETHCSCLQCAPLLQIKESGQNHAHYTTLNTVLIFVFGKKNCIFVDILICGSPPLVSTYLWWQIVMEFLISWWYYLHRFIHLFCWSLRVYFISVTNCYNVKCSLCQYISPPDDNFNLLV